MRKRMFLSFLLGFFVVASGADAAPARGNARGNNAVATQNTASAAAPVTARAGARQKVVGNTGVKTTSAPAASAAAPVSARAGARQKVVGNTGVKTTSAPVSSAATPMAARAGATQKVIQTGSKVATATANNAVPQECQDAFYGCMDSFCMLDNASGGRCQCNDRIAELDKVLEDILKLDEQTYVMATEGVERIQMGEAEEQIMARAKAAADKVTVEEKKTEDAKKKVRQLDLSAWNKTIFDEEEEDVFQDEEDTSGLVDTFINKRGDELYKSAANMCVQAFPAECKQYGSMVQLIYAQRIRSDCIAYENSLKQQKNASEQKLQTAQKALRDAALDEYKNQNKYSTAGECAVAFAQCMQTTAECGSDYTGCVTLAAKENVRSDSTGKTAKQTKIKGVVAGADITLAASTMEALLAKKEICMHVTKQCVNSNKNDAVWNVFLRNAAPALKSAEELAEQNLRMQCIPTLADYFKTACKSQIDPKDEEGSYDMCLSNPKTYKSLCKVQLEPCLEATGGTYDKPEDSSLWNSLIAALNAMKVDACTKQIRTCLTDRCGEDFAGCVGFDTETIGNICPIDKLTACVQDGRFSRNASDGKANADNIAEIREYIAEIAQGLAVQIDNSMLTVCQKAVNDSMTKVCGDTETCDALAKDEKLGARSLKYKVCKDGNASGTCRESFDALSQEELKENWQGVVTGQLYWGNISYDAETGKFTTLEEYLTALGYSDTSLDGADDEKKAIADAFNTEITQLESAITSAVSAIKADPTVTYCMTGRETQGFDSKKIGKKRKTVTKTDRGRTTEVVENEDAPRFPMLTEQMEDIIVVYALKAARDQYQEKYEEEYENMMKEEAAFASKRDKAEAIKIAKQRCKIWGDNGSFSKKEENKDSADSEADATGSGHSTVDEKYYKATINTSFNEATGVCTKETISQQCETRRTSGCKHWADTKTETVTQKLM